MIKMPVSALALILLIFVLSSASAVRFSHLAYGFTPQSTSLHVVINEMELNPTGTDAGNEWVELFNPASYAVSIGGWTMSTTAGQTVTATIPPGTVIQPYGYWVYTHASQWLDNADESIILRDGSSVEIDRTPLLSDSYNDGRSWARFPNGHDTDSTSDWRFQTATEGSSNGLEQSAISCIISPTNPMLGQEVEITGSIYPLHESVDVNVRITSPNGTDDARTVQTNSSGVYADHYLVNETGLWAFSASWQGDYDHQSAASSASTTIIIPEFSSSVVVLLFIIQTLLAVIVYKRKHVKFHEFEKRSRQHT